MPENIEPSSTAGSSYMYAFNAARLELRTGTGHVAFGCSEPNLGRRKGAVNLLQAVCGLVVLLAQIRDAELLGGDPRFDRGDLGAGGPEGPGRAAKTYGPRRRTACLSAVRRIRDTLGLARCSAWLPEARCRAGCSWRPPYGFRPFA